MKCGCHELAYVGKCGDLRTIRIVNKSTLCSVGLQKGQAVVDLHDIGFLIGKRGSQIDE
jgi:hypothetical protein